MVQNYMSGEEFQLLSDAIDRAELMGYDTSNPEVLGNIFKKIIDKIRAKRASSGGGDFSITTPKGSFSLTQKGASIESPTGTAVLQTKSTKSDFSNLFKGNNLLYIGAGALVLLLLLKK